MGKEAVVRDPRLDQGREILDASRERIAPLWVILKNQRAFLKAELWEQHAIVEGFEREIQEHVDAARGPISEAKLDLGLRLTQWLTERKQRKKIFDLVVFHGGAKRHGKQLANYLINLTKAYQAERGVSDEPVKKGKKSNPESTILFEEPLQSVKVA